MNKEKFLDELILKLERGKLTEKSKEMLHDKIMSNLDFEDFWMIFPDLFKAGILSKIDAQVFFEEILMMPDRVERYYQIFYCLGAKANFLSKKQLDELKYEVINLAPINVVLNMIYMLKETKFLGRDELEHIAERILEKEHHSCYAQAVFELSDLDVFEPEDLEVMWQRTMAIGDVQDCVELACILKDEGIVDKKEILYLFDECLDHANELDSRNANEKEEMKELLSYVLSLEASFYDQKIITPKMIEETKEMTKLFEGDLDELEFMNILCCVSKKQLFSDEEIELAKKRFMKNTKTALKKGEESGKFDFPVLGTMCFEKGVIDWSKFFTKQDIKVLKEAALNDENLTVSLWCIEKDKEKVKELMSGLCSCDCEDCCGC